MKSFLKNYYKGRIDINLLKEFQYILKECNHCKLIFQQFIPDHNFSEKLYEDIIDKEDSLLKKDNFEKKNYKKLSYEINLINNIFKKKPKDISILEFGAGWGFWLNYLKIRGYNVHGYEVSESRINFMTQNKINVLTNIDNINNKFDFIFSEQTFEHISNPKEMLLSLSKILKEEGYIFLRFPSAFLFKPKLNKSYKPNNDCAHPLEHINLFKKNSFKAMVSDTNLEIISLKSKFSFSIKNTLKDIKNLFYFDNVLIKKINK